MLVPLLPFKLISFAENEHIIFFVNDKVYEAIEFFNYNMSVSGKGIEIILTKIGGEQLVISNNPNVYNNLIKAKRKVYPGEIELQKEDKDGMLRLLLSCKSKKYNINMDFQSLFPVSGLRDGKVDPQRHSDKGMPFMYSSMNTVGINCSIQLEGRDIEILNATENTLAQFKGQQAYFSQDFQLVVLSEQDKKINYGKRENESLIYTTQSMDKLTFTPIDVGFKLKYSNYTDDTEYIILSKIFNNFISISNIQLNIVNKSNIFIDFSPELKFDIAHDCIYNGKMKISLIHSESIFDCNIKLINHVVFHDIQYYHTETEFTISYENADWKEKSRTAIFKIKYEIDKNTYLIQEMFILNFEILKY